MFPSASRCSALVALCAVASFATAAAAEPAATPGVLAAPAPGSGAGIVFVDALKQAAPWSSAQPLTLDANGNVMSLRAGQIADATVYTNEKYPAGDYTLLFDGHASFAVSGGTIVAQSPGRDVVRVSPNGGAGLHLRLLATDPADYARNVRLILPGYESTYAKAPFYPSFLQSLAPLRVIRFSEWSRADTFANSAVWPKRPGVDRFTQALPGGVAPEYEIALANATGKTPWFALPVGATNLYVRNFAQLVHQTLDPRLPAIFQYGGDVWRSGTPGNAWAVMAGRNARLAGDPQTAALDWYATRSLQVFDIVESAFGKDTSRVVRTLTGPAPDAAGLATDRTLIARAAGHADAFAFATSGDTVDASAAALAHSNGLQALAPESGPADSALPWTPRALASLDAYHAPLQMAEHARRHLLPAPPAIVAPVDARPDGPQLEAMVGAPLAHPDFVGEGNEDWLRFDDGQSEATPFRSAHLIHAVRGSLSLDVPAGDVTRTLRVYVSANRVRPVLHAALSDGSASPVSIAYESRFGRSDAVYTVVFHAKSASTLHVSITPGAPGATVLRAATLHSAAAPTVTPSPSSMVIYHNDNSRSGWDPNEYVLNQTTVASSKFGKLGTVNVQGDVLAQPLYVANYNLGGSKGVHNMLVVATEHNMVYEFDADSGAVLNSRLFGTSQSSTDLGCHDISPEDGITSTPVIDLPNNTMYFVAADETTSGKFEPLLFSVNLATLAPRMSPVQLHASAKMSNGSIVQFNPKTQQSRTGLVLSNGTVYVGIGSHCDNDEGNTTGWLLGYNSSLKQTAALPMGEDTSSGLLNSIWMTGFPSAVDASGNLFAVTGNGSFDASSGGTNYGESAIKVAPDLSKFLSYFTPSDYSTLNQYDGDFGSGGIMLLPKQAGKTPDLAVAMGKASTMYLLDTNALGGLGKPVASYSVPGYGVWGGPAYYNGPDGLQVFYQTDNEGLSDYALQISASGTPSLVLQSQGSSTGAYGGSMPIVSSWGQMPNTGVVWLVQRNSPLRLEAYSAGGGTKLLFAADAGTWSNSQNNGFVTPTVANGKVFVPASGTITAFGLQ